MASGTEVINQPPQSPGWKTALTKVTSGIGIVFSTSLVVAGVAAMVAGGGARENFSREFGYADGDLYDRIGSIVAASGLATAALGVAGVVHSSLAISVAGDAAKQRKFAELKEQLDAKGTGHSK